MKNWLTQFFIPHAENNYAPHSLQKAAMVGMLFLVVLSFTLSNVLSLFWVSSQWMVSTILPAVIVDLTNQERSVQSLGLLKRSAILDEAATLKAQDMAKHEYFAHYSPDGISPWYWFGQAKYNFVHAGENLAIHFTDTSAVMQAWMDSPTHRKNIMDANYTEIGIGTAEGSYQGFQTVYVVQLFGTPAVPVVANATPAIAGATTVAKDTSQSKKDTQVLAEAVSITESVAVIKAEPVSTEKEAVVDAKTTTSTENGASTTLESTVVTGSNQATGTTLTSIERTDQRLIVYSDFMSTSTAGIPASIDANAGTQSDSTPFVYTLATQPHKILQILYVIIGLFVFCSLILSIFIEIRHQQPVQLAYGVGLMVLMFCLLYIHVVLTTGVAIV